MDDAKKNDSHAYLSLRLVRVGSVQIAVPEAEVLSVVDWREPSPLPFAPRTVLGVISVQGRILTVLDTAKLLGVDSDVRGAVLALRGKEQLGLVISGAEEPIGISASDMNSPVELLPVRRGTIERDGRIIHILATEKLFAAALQGHERRRRRF